MIDIVEELLGLAPGGGGQRTVVLHGPADSLPPELPAAQPGQEPGIGPGIDESAQLPHGVGGVFIGTQELPAQQALLPGAAGPFLLLLHAVEDIGLGGLVVHLLEEGLLHGVLDFFDVDDFLAHGGQLVGDGLGHGVDGSLIPLPGRRRGQRDGPMDKARVKGHHLAAALAYVHSVSSYVTVQLQTLHIVYPKTAKVNILEFSKSRFLPAHPDRPLGRLPKQHFPAVRFGGVWAPRPTNRAENTA